MQTYTNQHSVMQPMQAKLCSSAESIRLLGVVKVVTEICLYGVLKNALQDFNLITEASMLNHAPGNVHMGFIWVNAV